MIFMSKLKCFTTKEVARLCRVSDATVKRWEDAGLLKSERTNGGHRRFRAEEVARFQRQQNLGLKQSHGDNSVTKINLLRQTERFSFDSPIFKFLLAGCEMEAANLLIGEYLDKKSPAEIFDTLICPSMREIGELWANDELTISEEHIATRTACNAIHKLRNSLPVPVSAGASAMCCAVERDFHELPTFLTQIIFENEGWEVMNFGANTPLNCLTKEILKHQPNVICISATFIEDFAKFSEDYKNFIKRIETVETSIILGGKAFADISIRQLFPKAIFIETFAELSKFTHRASFTATN